MSADSGKKPCISRSCSFYGSGIVFFFLPIGQAMEDLAASWTSPFILIFFHLSALRSVWFAFSKEVGPEMNSSQIRKASTRAEPLVKLMLKRHALPKSCVLSPFEANRVSYTSACPRLQIGGCVVQICHIIWVNCGQTPGHAIASFFSGLFLLV